MTNLIQALPETTDYDAFAGFEMEALTQLCPSCGDVFDAPDCRCGYIAGSPLPIEATNTSDNILEDTIDASVTFTEFKSKTVTSKIFSLENDVIHKCAAAQVYDAVATRITLPFSQFVETLNTATEHNFIAFGQFPAEYSTKVNIRVSGKENPEKNTIARTKEYFKYEKTQGLIMFDHDPNPYGAEHTPESLLVVLASIVSEFEKTARIIRGSLSAGVHLPDHSPKTGKGFHVYMPVLDASDIPRFGEVLCKRLWLAGHGFIALSKSGALLERTIIDGVVFSPERADFIGKPIVRIGLSYTQPVPDYQEGLVLNTTLLPDLTDDEQALYQRMVMDAKTAIKPQSEEKKVTWGNDKVAELADKGVSPEKARACIEGILKRDVQVLYGDFLLHFTTGSISVAELLKNGAAFDNKPLADPIEGVEYGTNTAKFYWNKGQKPLIHSFAHGAELNYFLHAEEPLEPADDYPSFEKRPCYKVYEDWWYKAVGGKRQKPGVWHFTATAGTEKEPPRLIDSWLCSPLYVLSNARSRHDVMWGSVLKFRNKDNKWHYWNMPAKLLAGTTVEIIGELADRGIDFDRKKRNEIPEYINTQHPKARIFTAADIGWFTTTNGKRFVLPAQTLGGNDDVIYRGDFSQQDNHFLQLGTLDSWRTHVASLAVRNHYLTLCIAVGFSGALLEMLAMDGVGIHAFEDSSCGKSTGQAAASSIWGNPKDCVKSWKTTANGLEGAAALFNDGLLALDEMGDAEPKEVSDALYMLVNGRGKNRANVNGLSRKSNVWRVATLSNGEHPIETFLAKKGMTAQAGQLARFLQIPVLTKHGVHDDIHDSKGGADFSDRIKTKTAQNYGTAGIAFIENLLTDNEQLIRSKFDVIHNAIQEGYGQLAGQEHRAAKAFALIALAGELATNYGITGWNEGSVLKTAKHFFKAWRDYRGHGDLEPSRILDAIRSYTERFGDARFTCIHDDTRLHGERSGYWRDTDKGRQWLFTNSGLQQATQGYDIKQVTKVLRNSIWLEKDSQGKTTKTAVFKNNEANTKRFYHITIQDNDSPLENTGVIGDSGVSSLNLNANNPNTFENTGVNGVSFSKNTSHNTYNTNTDNTLKNAGVSEIHYTNQDHNTAITDNTDFHTGLIKSVSEKKITDVEVF